MKFSNVVLCLGSSLLLAACGGGGGGGDAGTDNGQNALRLTITEPNQIELSAYEGQTLPSILIAGRFNGIVTSLYLYLEFPDAALFEPTPGINADSDNRGGNIQLFGAVLPAGERDYSGEIKVHACKDAACTSELEVVNGSIPYVIHAKKGLKLDRNDVTLATTFGSLPTPTLVQVGLPKDLVSWEVLPTSGPTFGVFQVTKAPDGTGSISVSAEEQVMPETTYTEDVLVRATTLDGQILATVLHLNMVTGASSKPFAFQIPKPSITFHQGVSESTDLGSGGVMFPGGDSDKLSYVGINYYWPTAADGNSFRDGWLDVIRWDEMSGQRTPGQLYYVTMTARSCDASTCLPAGRYAAVEHYRYVDSSGMEQGLDRTITLDVLP